MLRLVVTFAVALLLVAGAQSSEEHHEHKPHVLSKHSFKPPFLQGGSHIPHWEYFGDAMLTSDAVRLTPKTGGAKGSIWNLAVNHMTNWVVDLQFHISGASTGSDGLVFWYIEDPQDIGSGDLFGMSSQFKGIGVFFDTLDNDQKGNNPAVVLVNSDGEKEGAYPVETDGAGAARGQCTLNYRNTAKPVDARIIYKHHAVTVLLDVSGDGNFQECLHVDKIVLETGYHFGVSASTGPQADVHEIRSFIGASLNLPKAHEGGEGHDVDGQDKVEASEDEDAAQWEEELEKYAKDAFADDWDNEDPEHDWDDKFDEEIPEGEREEDFAHKWKGEEPWPEHHDDPATQGHGHESDQPQNGEEPDPPHSQVHGESGLSSDVAELKTTTGHIYKRLANVDEVLRSGFENAQNDAATKHKDLVSNAQHVEQAITNLEDRLGKRLVEVASTLTPQGGQQQQQQQAAPAAAAPASSLTIADIRAVIREEVGKVETKIQHVSDSLHQVLKSIKDAQASGNTGGGVDSSTLKRLEDSLQMVRQSVDNQHSAIQTNRATTHAKLDSLHSKTAGGSAAAPLGSWWSMIILLVIVQVCVVFMYIYWKRWTDEKRKWV